jgi:hypothetical protein
MRNYSLQQAVARLSALKGQRLKALGEAPVDVVSVRRYREALGLSPDPQLGVPPMMVAHLLRPDANVDVDVRPRETIDAVLVNPVNGGTEVTFTRALRLDEVVNGELLLADAYLREGKNGPLAIVITEAVYRDASGADLARVRSTMVYRGAVI